MRRRLHDKRWERIARKYRQDHPQCEVCLAELPEADAFQAAVSEEVDHILPAFAFPQLVHRLSNLQALCKAHHEYKTLQDRKAIYLHSVAIEATRVVVCGLPGSGKTTFAQRHSIRHRTNDRPGWVWDADEIAACLHVEPWHADVNRSLGQFVTLVSDDDHPFCIVRTDLEQARSIAHQAGAIVCQMQVDNETCQERVRQRDQGLARESRLRAIRLRPPDVAPGQEYDGSNPGGFE